MSASTFPQPSQPHVDPRRFEDIQRLYQKLLCTDNVMEVSTTERISAFRSIVEAGGLDTLAPLLPLIFNHEGKPYSLEHHFQFETLFSTRVPKCSVLYCARQVSKSTTLSSSGVAMAACIPRFKQLFVTPLFEQVRRLSNNYVRPFIDGSPVRELLIDSSSGTNVLQRSFINESMLQFTFALMNADRARGISTHFVRYDEAQNMNSEFFPIIGEAMSHSPWELTQWAGTPLTPENTLTGLWRDSSMAEWFIPCHACNEWNIPSTEFHLEAMTGPWREDIGIGRPGLVCHHCKRPIFANQGGWVHRHPDKRWSFAGYHVPQQIMAIHYSSAEKWAQLLAKREGGHNYTPDRFKNEVCGEACGSGAQVISQDDLIAASLLPWANNPDDPAPEIFKVLRHYKSRVLAIDWGGGGKRTTRGGDPVSLTVLALMGIKEDGQVHVLWSRRLYTPYDHLVEAAQALHYFKLFKCKFLAHDYTGAGSLRETFLVQTKKISIKSIIPIRYVRSASAAFMTPVAATKEHPRNHYNVDKARSLQATCAAIRLKAIKFFKWDKIDAARAGLISDFLGLVEEKIATRSGSDAYTISRSSQSSDDFAQAVNIGACCLWWTSDKFPVVSDKNRYELSPEFMSAAEGPPDGQPSEDYNESDFNPYE